MINQKRNTKSNEKAFQMGDTTFWLNGGRFGNLKEIGRGSYGVVVSAHDSLNDRHVAIKKITPVAKHTVDAKHVLREIRLMRYMGRHDNIVSLEELIFREHADELYIIMELLDSDLHRVLQSKQVITESHFRVFMHQLLCGVKYLHDNRIIHRDLKPGNILISADCKLRITDFGLARERPEGKGDDPDTGIDVPMTEHVVTRWYRPPELMLCPDGLYTYAVDMWSCGCILGEMLGRRPIFPGKNFIHQLTLIFDVIGSPISKDIAHIKNMQARKFLDSQGAKTKTPFQLIYPDASPGAIDLLDKLLLFAPSDRMNVDVALQSSYLAAIKDTASLNFPDVSSNFEFGFERTNLSKFQLKQLIMNESQSFKKEKSMKNNEELLKSDEIVIEEEKKVEQPSSSSLSSSSSSSSVAAAAVSSRNVFESDLLMKQKNAINSKIQQHDENNVNELINRVKRVTLNGRSQASHTMSKSKPLVAANDQTKHDGQMKRKTTTIPKSPQFQKMSWQTRGERSTIRPSVREPRNLGLRKTTTIASKRTSSAGRMRKPLEIGNGDILASGLSERNASNTRPRMSSASSAIRR